MGFGALSLKGRALRWLSQREHSRLELERKLARHAQDGPETDAASQIAAVLDELAAKGLLDEARAAASVLHVQGQRCGARRLRHTLQAKGLPADIVADALQSARATEFDRARAVWQRRYGATGAPADAAERARQMRFLAGRGFEAEVIRRVVAGAGKGDDDDAASAGDDGIPRQAGKAAADAA